MYQRPDDEPAVDPIREMMISLFMGVGFFSTEPDRLVSRRGAEALYAEMQTRGIINLDRDDILAVSKKFGEGFFIGLESASEN